jgi:hypothetical protein
MAFADLIRADALAAIALWAVDWMGVILGAVSAAMLVAAWLLWRPRFPRTDCKRRVKEIRCTSRRVSWQNRVVHRLLVTEADYANLSLLDSPDLRRWLARATRIWSDAMPANVVTMNSRVVCTDLASGGARRALSVVYPDYADAAAGRLSVLTEAGMALLGSSPPKVLEWTRPDGHTAACAHRGAGLPARAGPAQ